MSEQPSNYKEFVEQAEQLVAQYHNLSKSERNVKEAKLLQQAKKYGLNLEVRSLFKDVKEHDTYAITKAAGKNTDYGMIPLRNAEEVKLAASWLTKHRTRLPYNDRRRAAARVLMKCAEFGIILSQEEENTLFRMAGLGIGSKELIVSQLEKRAKFFERRSRPEVANMLRRITNEIENTALEDIYKEAAIKIAHEIDSVDKISGIYYNYGKEYLPPEDFLYSTTTLAIKEAEEKLVPNVKTGKYYHADDLENAHIPMLRVCIGDYETDRLLVCNVVSPTMCKVWLKQASKEQAEAFDRAMLYSGVRPYAEKIPE